MAHTDLNLMLVEIGHIVLGGISGVDLHGRPQPALGHWIYKPNYRIKHAAKLRHNVAHVEGVPC